MIYVKLHGRFGNHLFQIATGLTLGKRFNDEVCFYTHEDYLLYGNETLSDYIKNASFDIYSKINIIFEKPNIDESFEFFRQKKFSFIEIAKNKPNLIIDGSFQSFKYFDIDLLKEVLNFPQDIVKLAHDKYLNNGEINVLNIRRGDYLLIPHKFPVCSLNYFRKGMRKISNKNRYTVIGDDINWMLKKFQGPAYLVVTERDPLLHLYLLTRARNIVISNSSFSLIGAYLNPLTNKMVVYPSNWFGKSKEVNQHDVSDLALDGWISVKNNMEISLRLRALFYLSLEWLLTIRNAKN